MLLSSQSQNMLRKGTAHLLPRHIVKYWGLPKDIVSDRDSRFTGIFWTELFKILGSKLSMSSSSNPQSDGQIERFNSVLEEYLRYFVCGTQKDWEWKQNVDIIVARDLQIAASSSSCGRPGDVKVPDPRSIKGDPLIADQKDVSFSEARGRARNQTSRPTLELTKTKEKGCSSGENTWERVTNLKAFLPLVEALPMLRLLKAYPTTFTDGTAQPDFADRRWTSAILES
ncbi:UNVERIFIED_CONTAM: hypothetical protein Slati_1888500 [Sesamum latifolium]|uniref:Integrase catalytic domain-containing protein n=1 Tax=Sesamum latifolium TaxID=2727402 RepID=A0AAW2X221_9LAMI